jgi:hypothetical protein
MAYTITTTTGATLATVADGTVNTTSTSLTLIGKNYAGYGIFLNENYIKLLENFAYSASPLSPVTGQLWYDTANKLLKMYNGSIWKALSNTTSSVTQPNNPNIGDFWWDVNAGQLKVWSGSLFVIIGPINTSATGTSGALVETIVDTDDISHVVVRFYISNATIAIMTRSEFTPNPGIAGFTRLFPGMNLISSTTLANSRFSGDVSNALRLQNIPASDFLRSDLDDSTNYKLTVGELGVGSDIDFYKPSGSTEVRIENKTLNHDLSIRVNQGDTLRTAIRVVGANSSVLLGGTVSSQVRTTGPAVIAGALTAQSTLAVSGTTTITGSLLPSGNGTVSIGSTSARFADVWATTFRGTAITAQYADLAERFEADVPMEPGTVVELGGTKEITAAVEELSEAVFGVISTAAAFLMNGGAGTDETHPPIAVNGRVPVRVIGKINKGDRLVSAGNGLARAGRRDEITAFNVLGRALESKTTNDEGTIEAIVRLNN